MLLLGYAADLAAQRSIYPPSSTASIQAGESGSASFQLINNDPTNWNASVSCIAEGVITSCSVEPTSVVLSGFSEQEVSVTFTTAEPGSGVVRILADGLEAVLEVTVTLAQPLYVVSPDGPAVSALPGLERRDAFTVANNSAQALTISLRGDAVAPYCRAGGQR